MPLNSVLKWAKSMLKKQKDGEHDLSKIISYQKKN